MQCVFTILSIVVIVMYYVCVFVSPTYRIFYMTALIWQFLLVVIHCGAGCLVPICIKCLKVFEEDDKRHSVTHCVRSLLLFIEFIMQIIVLIANLVVVYADNQMEGVDILGIITSGSVCVLVLLCLVIQLCTFVCHYKESEVDWISDCCEDVGDSCSGAVTRCCKLCRRRERQYVGIHGMPQMEPEPPYDTIEMLPVNESQMEPVPPYDTIEMLPVNESQMEPVPPYDTIEMLPVNESQMETYTPTQ